MKNNEKILDFYKEQLKFGYIESVTIYKNIEDDSMVNNLKISFFKYPHNIGYKKLLVIFNNVQELKIKELEGLYKTVLSITDISSYQMENIKYKVTEDENALICFNCNDFNFALVE